MAGKNRLVTSLGALAREYYERGPKAAAEVLSRVPQARPDETFYQHLRPTPWDEEQRTVHRTEEGTAKTVTYLEFDPPPNWENPYQIMKVEVDPSHETKYLSHTGEEYLLPFDGPGVRYNFYWAEPGKSLPRPWDVDVQCGEVIRIIAEVPHSATGVGETKTRAWMITRPVQESSLSIYHEGPRREVGKRGRKKTRDTNDNNGPDWSDPATFALRAWGISEQLRLQRVRNNLRVQDVADKIPMNASHFSKIEEAAETANPTLETLKKIADVLDLDLAELISPPIEHSRVSENVRFGGKLGCESNPVPLFRKPPVRRSLIENTKKLRLEKHWNDHFVHLQRWCFKKGTTYTFEEANLGDTRWPSTWIVFEGEAKLVIEFGENRVEEAVLPESVLHIRGGGPKLSAIEARENTVIIQVNYSRNPRCNCATRESP